MTVIDACDIVRSAARPGFTGSITVHLDGTGGVPKVDFHGVVREPGKIVSVTEKPKT